ncbi:MAG: hypothetical protein QNJ73_06650 [Gammaproteobacteria bacterium]|nr:hypothetical protein [Gammaproteobacteria bacterium]
MNQVDSSIEMEPKTEADEKDLETEGEDTSDTAMSETLDTDNIGGASVEIDVDELIAEMEAEGVPADHLKDSDARKRLDEIMEQKRMSHDLVDFDDIDFDSD